MNTIRNSRFLMGGLALALLLLLFVNVVVYRTTSQLAEQGNRVARTYDVVIHCQKLIGYLVDAETGQRGFIIVGEESFLETYHEALGQISQELSTLRKLTAENPRQQRRLDALEPLVATKLEGFKERIALRRTKGFEAARQNIIARHAREVMDEIRHVVDELEKEETDLLRSHEAAAQKSARNALLVDVVGSGLSLALLLFVFFKLNQEVAERRRAEEALRQAHDELEQRVVARTAELAAANDQLKTEIAERERAAETLRRAHDDLEKRSAELAATNDKLKKEAAERARAEEIIVRQAREIMEVSTPVAQVWEGVVIATLIGTLDSERTRQFVDRLLNRIVETQSEVALVDITGVPAIDTQTARHLIEAISSVRMLGAQVILTGVRPAIAQTLVHLGINLSDVVTRTSIAGGLRVALDMLSSVGGNAGRTSSPAGALSARGGNGATLGGRHG